MRGKSRGSWLAVAAGLGAAAVGAALIESALVPGLVLGVAVSLAPRYWAPRARGRGNKPARTPKARAVVRLPAKTAAVFARIKFERAALKTITFRIVVTALDFSVNYAILGDLAVAAGLSGFSLVAGPLFYFFHETGWSYFGPRRRPDGREAKSVRFAGLTMSRTLGKTITYRIVATTAEFAATYVVVGDFATAALLSAFGFVLGPFVYYAHEWAWERLEIPGIDDAPQRLHLAPG